MHYHFLRAILCAAFFAVVIFVGGCGPGQFDVTGKVTYNGAPLDKPNGQIVFVGPKGDQVAATIGSDGTFHAEKVGSGQNQIAVYYPRIVAKKEKRKKLNAEDEPQPTVSLFLTPEKYAAPETSGISVTVEKELVYNIELIGPEIK